MGNLNQRRHKQVIRDKKIYIPKTFRQKVLPKHMRRVYQWIYPYILGGLCLCLSSMLLWGIWSYDPDYPSVWTVTTSPVQIAYLESWVHQQADSLLQWIGIGSIMVTVTLGTWGICLFSRQRISHIFFRGILSILSSIITSILAYMVHAWGNFTLLTLMTQRWPSGEGGAIGKLSFLWLNIMLQDTPAPLKILVVVTLCGLAFSLLLLSLGLTNQQIYKIFNIVGRLCWNTMYYLIIALRFIAYVSTVLWSRILKKNDQPMTASRHSVTQYQRSQQEPTFGAFMEDMNSGNVGDNFLKDGVDEVASEEFRHKGILESFKEKTFKSSKPRFIQPVSKDYTPPSLELLALPGPVIKDPSISRKGLEEKSEKLIQVLNEFGVKGRILGVKPGPVVTLYELEPAAGVKSSRIIGLTEDIARSMSARSARVSVIPGRNAMGIELPNDHRESVYFREILSSEDYQRTNCQLPLGLGKDIGGYPIIADLAKMPHLLVAGTTGSGKSVGINAMILSLLFKLSPDECKFIMIDPKMLELSVYDGIPHLLSPVVTDPKKAIVALKWVVQEMESRYRAMAQVGVRNIQGYNEKLRRTLEAGNVLSRRVQTGFDPDTGAPVVEEQPLDMSLFPYIVVVVDEMADLMLVAGKEIEAAVQRLAQMARAAGIHLIMATQRPSVDVITGTIKANFPTRIGFQVTSKIDSRTILGEQGAEQLLGRGDMLYMEPGGRIRRVHGAFVGDEEVERIVGELKRQQNPNYVNIYAVSEDSGGGYDDILTSSEGSGDDLYDKALSIVLSEGKVSTSFVQRHLSIGYNRAAKIVERMEKEGVVSAPNHSGKREILVPHEKKGK